MEGVPEFKNKVAQIMRNDPPEFLGYKFNKESMFNGYLANYTQMNYREGGSELYIRNDKWKAMTDTEKERMNYYGVYRDEKNTIK
jgi:hypothetical protein